MSVERRVPGPWLNRLPTAVLTAAASSAIGRCCIGMLPPPEPPHPTVAISCGRACVPASIALRNASQGATLTVHVQRPPVDESYFDLVVAPRHDYSTAPPPPNVLLTDGALHGVTPELLQASRSDWRASLEPLPSPRLVLLIGGTVTRRFPWQRPLSPELTADAARELVCSAHAAACEAGGSLLVATSRRTSKAACEAIHQELRRHAQPAATAAAAAAAAAAAGRSGSDDSRNRTDSRTDGEHHSGYIVPYRVWSPSDEPNPYLGLLAWADYILATPDSISMASEACGASKPIFVDKPRQCSRRFLAFHEELLASGRTREWRGGLERPSLWAACAKLPAVPTDDVGKAAARIVEMLAARGVTV